MNQFGGSWTEAKIEMLVEYAKAYLIIMKERPFFKLMYFDGFAGSGFIVKEKGIDVDITVGAARRIVEVDNPRHFDLYYFVEKDSNNVQLLEANTKDAFPTKNIKVVHGDCNERMLKMAEFLRHPDQKNYRTLAYVDPCGMQLKWESIESMKGLDIDMWVLVPTGMGVSRLLKNDGNISEAWLKRLEQFLGLTRNEIESYFYTKTDTLFAEITLVTKERNAVEKSAQLYKSKLKEVFNYVSNPYVLKNSTNSIMYHLFLTSNNATGVKIGNDIVKKYNS